MKNESMKTFVIKKEALQAAAFVIHLPYIVDSPLPQYLASTHRNERMNNN